MKKIKVFCNKYSNTPLLLLMIICLFFLISCCFDIPSIINGGISSEEGLKKVLEDASSTSKAWIRDGNGKLVWQPSPIMNINTEQNGYEGKYFDFSKPLNFSMNSNTLIENSGKSASAGSPLDDIVFTWDFGNGSSLTGKEVNYTFSEPGVYTIKLTASFKDKSETAIETVWVAQQENNLLILKKHNCTAEVENIFTNNGPGSLLDTRFNLGIPHTIEPFQEIKNINVSNQNFKKNISENEDVFYKFLLGNIEVNNTVSLIEDYDIVINEFVLKENPIPAPDSKEETEKILKEYLKSEKYIDSNSPEIEDTVHTIIQDDRDQLSAAKKLYDFVTAHLEYDYGRDIRTNNKIFKASEILKINKGICQDYSILFAALCRAAGIPARYCVGIPVRSITVDNDRTLEYGHAWVELYLENYGWVSFDPTSEIEFLSENNMLNLRTYSEVEPKNMGFFWNYQNIQPGYTWQNLYRIKDITKSDITAMSLEQYQKMKKDFSGSQ
jgi:hypothetical protein